MDADEMDTDEWTRRGSSFGAVAAAYAEHRPDYPADAVRWCVAPTGRPVAGLRVLDLGAGTGKLTAVLAELGADVTAVEPDEAMLAELRRQLPSVRALHGPAEAIPLADGSVDAVLCGAVDALVRHVAGDAGDRPGAGAWRGARRAVEQRRRPGGVGCGAAGRGQGGGVAGRCRSGERTPPRSAPSSSATSCSPRPSGPSSPNPQARTVDSLLATSAPTRRCWSWTRPSATGCSARSATTWRRAGDRGAGSSSCRWSPRLSARSAAERGPVRAQGYRVQTWLPRLNLRRFPPANCTTRPCTGHSPCRRRSSSGSCCARYRRRRRSRGTRAKSE